MRGRILRLSAYALVGVVTGLAVSAIELVALRLLLESLLERDLWQQALAPGLGLLIAVLLLRWGDRGSPLSPSTSEEYIRAYHARHFVVRVLHLPFRLAAGIATIGLGGALGLEGPSIYAGSTMGASIQRKLQAVFQEKDNKALLVAGAAAGVSAIFQAPATGVLFALESPYKGDLGRRALLPSLISSAASYLTFVSVTNIDGEGVFGVSEANVSVGFGRTELLGAALVGLLCGVGAIGFARMVKWCKSVQGSRPAWQLVMAGAVVLGGLAVGVDAVYDEPLSLGPTAGVHLTNWVVSSSPSLWLVVLLLLVRTVAVGTSLAAGGVGGVFIPLAVSGLLIGRLVAGWVDVGPGSMPFFPFIGVAAFLAAGYRTPLTAVMFVAESSGAPQFVVPGLIAVAVSQVIIGSNSVSSHQHDLRTGHLEARFQMPITSAMRDVRHIVSSTDTISDFVWGYAFPSKEVAGIVADEELHFEGMIRLHDARDVDRAEWGSASVVSVMDDRIQPARFSWTIGEAMAEMELHDLDQYPVVDTGLRVVGVVTSESILKLDEILEETQGAEHGRK